MTETMEHRKAWGDIRVLDTDEMVASRGFLARLDEITLKIIETCRGEKK